MTNGRVPYEELARYLRQECRPEELAAVEGWIYSSEKNEQLFNRLKEEWLNVKETPDAYIYPDKGRTWSKIASQLGQKAIVKLYSRRFVLRSASIAAMLSLVTVWTFFALRDYMEKEHLSKSITLVQTMQGQKMQMTLPDGTKVWLNSGSRLSYTGAFNRDSRELNLQGEAFFDVKKDEHKKFIVNTSKINVVVKGTAFNVSAYPDDKNIDVSLVRGRIAVMAKNGRHLTDMKPQDFLRISPTTLKYSLNKVDADTDLIWMQNEVRFSNAGIREVAKKLERWYGVDIRLINPDDMQKYSFSVKTESLRELLSLFKKITPIEYTIDGKEVTIQYK